MDEIPQANPRNYRNRNILLAIFLASGALLTGILFKYRRKQLPSASSPPIKKKLLEKIKGLSADEIETRQQPDTDNSLSFKPVRSRQEIWRENILSIFNLSLVGLALVQFLFARPLDALLSLGILALNIGVNVFQENFARMRLKDILEETRPRVTVIRDQTTQSIDANQLVLGDMVAFGPGDGLLVDGTIVHQEGLVVDESMISGGERRENKREGDTVFAGSFCVAGHAVCQVERMGDERYITGLIKNSEKSHEQLTPIEIIIGNVLRILLVIAVIFTGVLVFLYLNIPVPIPVDLFNEVAGIIFSIAPAGLFFMIIVTYAASTVDLAKIGALVHRARSVEAMAQVNTICFSREGVLTGTKLELELFNKPDADDSIPLTRVQQILGDFVRSTGIENKITRTIHNEFPGSPRKILDEAPYLSVYGWSSINFNDPDLSGTYVLGVPAIIEPHLEIIESKQELPEESKPGRVRSFTSRLGGIFRRSKAENEPVSDSQDLDHEGNESPSRSPLDTRDDLEDENQAPEDSPEKPGLFRRFLTRVTELAQPDSKEALNFEDNYSDAPIELIFAYYPEPSQLFDSQGRPQFPIPLTPLCRLSFSEQVRPESVAVIKSFHDEGMAVKIFAADSSPQIAEIMRKAGLGENLTSSISGTELSQMGEESFAKAAQQNGIFLNLLPEQMGAIVAALRNSGQHVAMVGDAVNDVPAMREADLAASYKYSSPAAQSLADILLLENSLNVLDRVLDKGQRIVNGLLDILKLYLTQVTYLSLMIVGIALIGIGFPLRGIQLTIVTTVTITIPSLGFTLWANPGVLYGNSLRKSLSHFIIPSAITIAIAGVFTFFHFGGEVPGREYAHLAVTYTLVFMGLLVVLFLRPPFSLLAGGAPLSQDRRMFKMVLVLTGLFFVTVALSAAIPFLFDLLLLDWLTPFVDYVIVIAIVFVWAAALLLIWRVWRIAGLDRIFKSNGDATDRVPRSDQPTDDQIQQTNQAAKLDS